MDNKWVDTKERMPETEGWYWVWFQRDNEDGYCDKMLYSKKVGWKINSHAFIREEYQYYIKAWQPYYEPEPYKSK